MKIYQLDTAAEVVEKITRDRLYKITGKRSQNVTNWLTAKTFPPDTFEVMQLELRRIGFRAPSKLWRQIQPPKELQVLRAA
jgi:hypothetical protein